MIRSFLITTSILLTSFSAFAGDDVWDSVEHHFVDNNGVNIHYVSIGEGPVVLFVHGFPDFWYSWNAQMAGLKDSFKCVAMDTRGYNQSDKPEGVDNYQIDVLLTDIGAVIADLGADSVTLVGHDWGGGLAWRYAMLNQDQISKLIICNLTHPKGYAAVRANATPEQAASMQYIERFQDPNAASMFNPMMVATISAGADAPAEVKARYVKAFEQSSFDGMLNYYRAAWPMFKGEVQLDIPDLDIPVLQFHGMLDTAVDKDGLRDTWNWITKDYTLVTIPGKGHWIQREAPDLVTTTMKWWMLSRPAAE